MPTVDFESILQAAHLLRRGELVAFPTETVYGLGADATSAPAVAKIFAAKGRPSTNPLIVHVADVATARLYVTHWPDEAKKLTAAFWPGPLTLILPKSARIVDGATAGRASVALRVPSHPVALQLLRAFGGPVAAPSANRSMRISPTTAEHVRQELGDAVAMILDGGPCRIGIESTVLDLTPPRPSILRPGAITRQQIEAVIAHPVEQFSGEVDPAQAAASPGQHAVHYSPGKPAFRFTRLNAPAEGQKIVVIQRAGEPAPPPPARLIEMPTDAAQYAARLYAALREADAMAEIQAIYIQQPPDDSAWDAVRDRIRRATRPAR